MVLHEEAVEKRNETFGSDERKEEDSRTGHGDGDVQGGENDTWKVCTGKSPEESYIRGAQNANSDVGFAQFAHANADDSAAQKFDVEHENAATAKIFRTNKYDMSVWILVSVTVLIFCKNFKMVYFDGSFKTITKKVLKNHRVTEMWNCLLSVKWLLIFFSNESNFALINPPSDYEFLNDWTADGNVFSDSSVINSSSCSECTDGSWYPTARTFRTR